MMPQVEVPIPRETALRLRIAMLEWDQALLQIRLLQQQADTLMATARRAYQESVARLLAEVHPDLPAPETALTLDLEGCCVRYEVTDPCKMVDMPDSSV